jgi:hypothetical protein
MRYCIINNDEAQKPWKVHHWLGLFATEFRQGTCRRLPLASQITPDIPFPHLHVYPETVRRHYPTGRVLIEDVLGLAVEMGAEPRDKEKWARVSKRNIENFKKGATWGLPG